MGRKLYPAVSEQGEPSRSRLVEGSASTGAEICKSYATCASFEPAAESGRSTLVVEAAPYPGAGLIETCWHIRE